MNDKLHTKNNPNINKVKLPKQFEKNIPKPFVLDAKTGKYIVNPDYQVILDSDIYNLLPTCHDFIIGNIDEQKIET